MSLGAINLNRHSCALTLTVNQCRQDSHSNDRCITGYIIIYCQLYCSACSSTPTGQRQKKQFFMSSPSWKSLAKWWPALHSAREDDIWSVIVRINISVLTELTLSIQRHDQEKMNVPLLWYYLVGHLSTVLVSAYEKWGSADFLIINWKCWCWENKTRHLKSSEKLWRTLLTDLLIVNVTVSCSPRETWAFILQDTASAN